MNCPEDRALTMSTVKSKTLTAREQAAAEVLLTLMSKSLTARERAAAEALLTLMVVRKNDAVADETATNLSDRSSQDASTEAARVPVDLTCCARNDCEDCTDVHVAASILMGLILEDEEECDIKFERNIICHGNFYARSKLTKDNAIWSLLGLKDPSKVASPKDPAPTLEDHDDELQCPRCSIFNATKLGQEGQVILSRDEREQTVALSPDGEDDLEKGRGGCTRYDDEYYATNLGPAPILSVRQRVNRRHWIRDRETLWNLLQQHCALLLRHLRGSASPPPSPLLL